MKAMKIFMLAGALAVSATASAQESYAPVANDFSVEIQFNPFSNNFTTFQIDQLKGRYMFSDKDALRFGIGFGVDQNKITPDPEDAEETWGKAKTGNFSINLGWERHFFNYKRVDLYAGAGIGYRYDYAGATIQTLDSDDKEIKGSIVNCTDEDGSGDRTMHQFYVNAFTGIDFYVYKGLYVGAELGIKFGFKSMPAYFKKGDYNDNNKWDEDIEGEKRNKVSGFNLACYAEPALRLGWTF